MKPDFRQLYDREKQVSHIINKVETRGLRFDVKRAQLEARKLKAKIKRCLAFIHKAGCDNPNSPKQVLALLVDAGVDRKLLTQKGKLTTEVNTLMRIKEMSASDRAVIKQRRRIYDFISCLLEYRSYTKTVNTYLEPLANRAKQCSGIIYCSINPTDTRTGRMASREPNLQNIPEAIKRQTGQPNPIRSCFICREGFSNYYFDFSQMEIALFGLWTNEECILKPYAKGEDIHDYMASYIYGKKHDKRQRDLTKNISYGKIYGLGVRAMALRYQMTEADARRHLRRYEDEFPSIRRFQYECKDILYRQGYVEDWFGRRYHIPVGQAYKAVNALVQGSCAQIFKIALIKVDNFLDETGFPVNILLPVHDELQIEARQDYVREREKAFCVEIARYMTGIRELTRRRFQLRVDVSKTSTNWAEKDKVEI